MNGQDINNNADKIVLLYPNSNNQGTCITRTYISKTLSDPSSIYLACTTNFENACYGDKNSLMVKISTEIGQFYVPYGDIINIITTNKTRVFKLLTTPEYIPRTISAAAILSNDFNSLDHGQNSTQKTISRISEVYVFLNDQVSQPNSKACIIM